MANKNTVFVARTTTDIAPVAAFPTTAAHFCLFNGEPTGGKSYDILAVSGVYASSAGVAECAQLLAHNAQAPVLALPSATAATGPLPLGGFRGGGTHAIVGSAVSIVNSSVWHPIGDGISTAATTTIGLGLYWRGTGIYTVPPGGIFSLATLAATNAGTLHLAMIWREFRS